MPNTTSIEFSSNTHEWIFYAGNTSTWNKPKNCNIVSLIMIGNGGTGGTTSTASFGGGGGGSGAIATLIVPSIFCPDTLYIRVPNTSATIGFFYTSKNLSNIYTGFFVASSSFHGGTGGELSGGSAGAVLLTGTGLRYGFYNYTTGVTGGIGSSGSQRGYDATISLTGYNGGGGGGGTAAYYGGKSYIGSNPDPGGYRSSITITPEENSAGYAALNPTFYSFGGAGAGNGKPATVGGPSSGGGGGAYGVSPAAGGLGMCIITSL